jgi:hypothetical protein
MKSTWSHAFINLMRYMSIFPPASHRGDTILVGDGEWHQKDKSATVQEAFDRR